MKRTACSFLVLAVLAFGSPAWAQVRCLSSFPPPDAQLQAAPGSVILWLNEPVDVSLSRFHVADPYGRRFDRPPRVSADGQRVEIPLEPLPDGVYVVHYRVSSALNGHVNVGLFRFGVRTAVPRPDAAVAVVAALRVAGALLTVAAVASGSAWLAAFAAGTALAEWGHAATSTVPAPLPVLLRHGWAGLLLAGTQPGWAALLAAATAAAWGIPARPPHSLLRTAAASWLAFVVPLVAAAGGPLGLLSSSHAAALVLMGVTYGVAGALAAVGLPVLGVRLEEPSWTPLLLGILLAAALALRMASSLQEFLALWVVLGAACTVVYAWTRVDKRKPQR